MTESVDVRTSKVFTERCESSNLSPGIVVLFRSDREKEEELSIVNKYFPVVALRSEVPENSLVIARYSALPFYLELEKDLKNKNSQLINSYAQHYWIASFSWYDPLKAYTPETWFEHEFYKCNYPGPFVVKGTTNSRKSRWKTHCFAENKKEALYIANELANDPLIGPQGIIYRKYIPLKTFEVDSISGMPYSNEYRIFCYKNKILSYGYYWSCTEEDPSKYLLSKEGLDFAKQLIEIIQHYANFYVIDIAETEAGDWILIEINDGQQSGLSENKPEVLYSELKKQLVLSA